MAALVAQIRVEEGPAEERGAARRPLRLEVAAARAGSGANALIHNLSETGLLLETSLALTTGETLRTELPHAGVVDLVVVWSRASLFGCEFTSPISRAAVSAALLLSPPRDVPGPMVATPALSFASDAAGFDEEPVESRVVLYVSLILGLLAASLFILVLLELPISGN